MAAAPVPSMTVANASLPFFSAATVTSVGAPLALKLVARGLAAAKESG